ncbi:MAG: hypothetical protein HC822_27180 [Oscillochloris sp.]|nr:hypothetical protein [Oscillochloris sp.]
MESRLGPYLTPEQATLLRYEGGLPSALAEELGTRLRSELLALRTLVPEPLAADRPGSPGAAAASGRAACSMPI